MPEQNPELVALWKLVRDAVEEMRTEPMAVAYWIGCLEEFVMLTECEIVRRHARRQIARLSKWAAEINRCA